MTEPAAFAVAEDAPERRSVGDRVRGILAWAVPLAVVLGLLWTLKWWGDQQQRAKLTGRSWPPEPVKVFFGR